MADTTSIASRMEKLAQLKRLKEGLTSEPAAMPAETASEVEVSPTVIPNAEGFESFPTESPFAAESADFAGKDLDAPEDFSEPNVSSNSSQASEDPLNFDPTDDWSDEETSETAPSSASMLADEVVPDLTSTSDGDVNFVMESPDDVSGSEPASVEETFNDETTNVQAINREDDQPVKGLSASVLGIDDDAFADFDEIAALAGAGGVTATVAAASGVLDDDVTESAEETELPDFSASEIEKEVLEREFKNEAAAGLSTDEPEAAPSTGSPISGEAPEGRITVAFDESRSTLLNHVSRQMGCSVEDVVVTALDWYLDALFGEDEEAKSA